MHDFCLVFDSRIPILEKANQWKTAVLIALNQWELDPDVINNLLCAGTQLWYTLLIMIDYQSAPFFSINFEKVSIDQLQSDLMRVTRYGFEHFKDNPLFNAYFGYMISVMPYFFVDYNGDYSGWKQKGIEMMQYSYILAPTNPFTKAMNYEKEDTRKYSRFYEACEEIWTEVTPEQWGSSEVQQYFFRVLRGDLFYVDAYS